MKPSDPLLLADVTLRCGMYLAGKVDISQHLAIPGFPQNGVIFLMDNNRFLVPNNQDLLILKGFLVPKGTTDLVMAKQSEALSPNWMMIETNNLNMIIN